MTDTLEKRIILKYDFLNLLTRENNFPIEALLVGSKSRVYGIKNYGRNKELIFHFQTDGIDEKVNGEVFDIKIRNGSADDLFYLETSTKLKNLLEAKQIPYTDKRNITELKEGATTYAEKLLRASLELK